MIMKTILVSAYGCEPLKGSEPGVGWNWVLQMAKYNKLHIITRANNQKVIEEYLPLEIKNNITFHYYDTPNFIKQLKNKAKGLYCYYFFWQIGILSLAKRIIKNNHIDYIMHLTFGSMWMPTFLPFLKTPFIWGPVGGAEAVPTTFLKMLPLKERIIQYSRKILNATTLFNPLVVIPSWKAKIIIVRTPDSKNAIPRIFQKKVKIYIETAMENNIFSFKKIQHNESQIRLIVSGRLVPFKNIKTAVKALKYIQNINNIAFKIIGSGPDYTSIQKMIKDFNLSNVEIVESLPRMSVLEELQKSDIYVFPSLREGGSWALMEAMAIGLPVICLNWSGMRITTNDSCAIRLPVTDPEQMPKDMADAIIKLVKNPELRKQMGENGRKRIQTVFNWEAKGKFMEELFAELDKHGN